MICFEQMQDDEGDVFIAMRALWIEIGKAYLGKREEDPDRYYSTADLEACKWIYMADALEVWDEFDWPCQHGFNLLEFGTLCKEHLSDK